jgi:hypothetical protein
MLKKHGDRMEPGSADEQKPAREGTEEARWINAQRIEEPGGVNL